MRGEKIKQLKSSLDFNYDRLWEDKNRRKIYFLKNAFNALRYNKLELLSKLFSMNFFSHGPTGTRTKT